MKSSSLPRNFEIAPGHRVRDWQKLDLDDPVHVTLDWGKAIAIFEERIRSRFIRPAQALIDSDKGTSSERNGFAVLAIDFLLIETVQGFKKGQTDHKGQSKRLFKEFLKGWNMFNKCVSDGGNSEVLAGNLYEQGRCALHHTGATDRMIVRKSKAMIIFDADGLIEINRTKFHTELDKAFASYLADLRATSNAALRENFRNKMAHICT